jgi:hypothetical protein
VEIHKQMGGLAMVVGYGIEDRLMPHIPEFVDTAFGIRADIVDRRNIVYLDGSYDEANIYVEGEKNGNRTYLIRASGISINSPGCLGASEKTGKAMSWE